jgi:hypothetical protein
MYAHIHVGASLIAGFTASACSLPFDLLKSRMQDGSKYKGISDAIVQIYTKEGTDICIYILYI